MNIIFKELHIRNILSFGNNVTVIKLNVDGSTFIVGQNIDDASANGAGKTAIINTICYACYNKPFDNISLQRLINTTNNAKNTLMEVRLIFEKNHDEYEIYRCRGESTNIAVFKNGENITLDSVAENDKLIVDILGLSYDLFTNAIIFSGSSTPFLLRPVAQQRQQVEELFNITLLSEKAMKLKEHIKETEASIAIQQAIIKERITQENLYNKQIIEAETRLKKWEDDREAKIATIQQQLEFFKNINIDEEKELHQLKASLKKQETELEAKKKDLTKEKASLATEVKALSNELHHLNDEKCPYCLQKFSGAAHKIDEKVQARETKDKRLQELQAELDQTLTSLDEVFNGLSQVTALIKYASLDEAVRAELIAQTAAEQVEEITTTINPHIEALKALKNQVINKISYDEIDRLKHLLENQQFMLKLLTDKNSFVRRKIINRTIPFLNKRLAYYTKELGLPHIVKFDDDMSCSVSELGRELDFGNLSGGQKKRVNLSLSLAFRDVLHHLHSRINILFLDEIDASLDSSGVDNVFRLLKKKSRDDNIAMWIISHRPEAVGRFDRTLIVRRENGFSNVITTEDE